MAAKKSLVEKAKAYSRPQRKTWLDRMTAAQRKELEELRASFHRGELNHLASTDLWRLATDSLPLSVGVQQFRLWIVRNENGETEVAG